MNVMTKLTFIYVILYDAIGLQSPNTTMTVTIFRLRKAPADLASKLVSTFGRGSLQDDSHLDTDWNIIMLK